MTLEKEVIVVKRNVEAYSASDGRALVELLDNNPVSSWQMIKDNNLTTWTFFLTYQDRD